MTTLRASLSSGAAACTIASAFMLTASPAHSQTTSNDDGNLAAGGGLTDIIVTAQRRDQKQQNVPIAIATISGDIAERTGVTGTETLTIAVPGLQFSRQVASGGAPFLRGVGNVAAAQGFEPPVAIYVDDVYIGSPGAVLMSLNNIKQVEVLKGPQGTLFGRNATGGVIHIRTMQPSLYETRVDAKAGYSNFDTVDGNIYVSTPLNEKVAVNVAAVAHHQGTGYGINLLLDEEIYKSEYYGGRAGMLLEPTDSTRIRLIGDYSWYKGDDGINVSMLPGAIGALGAVYQGRYTATAIPTAGGTNEQYGISARIDQEIGDLSLVSISAYRANNVFFLHDIDSSAPVFLRSDYTGRNRSFSQELQLQGPSAGKLNWIVGAFYYHADAGLNPLTFYGITQAAFGGTQQIFDKQILDSYSAFADLNYELLPKTKITLGIRYTTDKIKEDVLVLDSLNQPVLSTPFKQSDSFSKLTWRAILDYQFADGIMGYFSYSRGFKSGGYNLTSPTTTTAGVVEPSAVISPEEIDAFEVGLKTELFNRMLRLNLAAFTYDYANLQVTNVGLGVSTLINGAQARIKGIDLDFEAAPTSRLSINGGISVLDAKFSSFPNGPFTLPRPAVCAPVPMQTGPVTGGNITCSADLKGNRTPRAPKFTGNISATYTLPTEAGDFALTGNLYHNSGFVWEADNRLKQSAYTLLNATLSWTSIDGKYDVSLWGKNLTKEYYYTYQSAGGARDSGAPAAPRTYGITIGLHY